MQQTSGVLDAHMLWLYIVSDLLLLLLTKSVASVGGLTGAWGKRWIWHGKMWPAAVRVWWSGKYFYQHTLTQVQSHTEKDMRMEIQLQLLELSYSLRIKIRNSFSLV